MLVLGPTVLMIENKVDQEQDLISKLTQFPAIEMVRGKPKDQYNLASFV